MSATHRERVLWFRARAMHLHERLPSGAHGLAAYGALQDSAPRSAQLSLHARLRGATPSAWEHGDLVQLFSPRMAAYVVPRADVDVFTIGRLPRDADHAKGLDAIADAVHAVLAGRTMRSSEVSRALPDLAHASLIRAAFATGRLHMRWDTHHTVLIPVDAPASDPEDARLELARRFLRWLGPGDAVRFGWWAGVEKGDALATWRSLEPELAGAMLATDVDAFDSALPGLGVRLLPCDDPYLKVDHELLVPDPVLRELIFPSKSRGFLPGAVLVDGEIAGTWQRQGRKVSIEAWQSLGPDIVDAVEAEAAAFPIEPLSTPIRVSWTSL